MQSIEVITLTKVDLKDMLNEAAETAASVAVEKAINKWKKLSRKEILTIEETMEILGKSRNTLMAMVDRKEIELITVGKRPMFKSSSIYKLID